MTHTSLRALATAVPGHVIDQHNAAAISEQLFSTQIDFERLRPVYANSGIRKRHLAMPIEWYLQGRGWEERAAAFLDAGGDLFCAVTEKALQAGELSPTDIDIIVTVNSSGIATPSLEAHAVARMGFRNDVQRIPVFSLGCAGGVSGLALAQQLATANQGSNVLLVAIELCSLAFRLDKPTKSNVVATALFADGAAACILYHGENDGAVTLGRGRQHTWPDTTGIMGWKVDPFGFEVVFDRAIPPFARKNLQPVMAQFFDEWGLELAEIDRMSFHPGGMRVLDAIEAAFDLEAGSLDLERDILADFGNMSSPTALFVLERELAKKHSGISILSALGPGFTASAIPIRKVQ
ncbi:MAG: type III polyketide synthase [Pseudomonadota bacterium]